VTLSPRQVRALLAEHGLSPSRALGQNFVADPNTVRRIARLAEVGPGDRVVEIGPGLGSLTLALAETGAEVTAVELDRHLLPALRSVVEPRGVRVVHGDAMRLDWAALLGPPGDPAARWALVANLPYNVATPLVLDLLAGVPQIERMLVMVQREVAERLAASPGTRAYGALTVGVALSARVELLFDVGRGQFRPPPKVRSTVVRLVPGGPPGQETDRRERVRRLVRTAFEQRRKQLRNSLKAELEPVLAGGAGEDTVAGIDLDRRPETLSVEEWMRLEAALANASS
jgi:16S rRNA (adenine1518-N6/adenine1519-N6)-dimethyltransferase